MILKNITLALRHLLRYRTYSFLNIIGLAIGMASALLIFLWVQNELNYDKLGKDGKNIFILHTCFQSSNEPLSVSVAITSPLLPAILNEIPEVSHSVRVTWPNNQLIRYGDKKFYEKGFYVDSTFFALLPYKIILGNSATMLDLPNSIVISQKLAKKYFGNDNPIGKSFTVRDINNLREELFTVSGVFEDLKHSSLEFDYVMPFKKYAEYYGGSLHWGNYNMMGFIKTKPKTNPRVIENKITNLLQKNSFLKKSVSVVIQPVEDNYLYGDYGSSTKNPSGRIVFVRIFSIVALIILFLACMNYTNLATALAIKRAKEVGVKKAFGSNRFKLITQFTLEAVVLTLIGFTVSLVLVEFSLTWFNEFIGKQIELSFTNLKSFGWMLLIPVITGLFAGAFPAIYLSAFSPIVAMKSSIKPRSGKIKLRQVLVIFQFTITIAFIIASFVIVKQIQYIQNKSLGLNKENVLMFDQSMEIKKHRTQFKQDLKKINGVLNVTLLGSDPLSVNNSTGDPNWRGKQPDALISFPYMSVDEDFASTMGVEILEGRDFSIDRPADTNGIFINEKALKIMNLKNPIGEKVEFWGRKTTIIGVVKDFHISDLRVPLRQLIMFNRPSESYIVLVKIKGDRMKPTIKEIEKLFNNYENNVPFIYSFLDQEYDKRYAQEKYMGRLSNLFSVLAIIISCLGLFGLALFTAEQKTKEIGIRKSIGASDAQIILMLAREFLKWIAIAFVIASFIAYLLLNNWLSTFAYHTDFSWWIFILTGLITFLVALITVSWQSWRAASKNPIESLRYE